MIKSFLQQILKKIGYQFISVKALNQMYFPEEMHKLKCNFLLKKIFDINQNIVVFDVGANKGQTAIEIRSIFKNSTIYCFEPFFDTFSSLSKNVSEMQNIYLYNLALGSSSNKVKAYYNINNEWNSLVNELNIELEKNKHKPEVINIISLDEFAFNNKISKIDFLKIDTEGYEMQVLKGGKDYLRQGLVDVIYFEIGFDKGDFQHSFYLDVFNFLNDFDYIFSGIFETFYYEKAGINRANALFVKKQLVINI